MSRSQRRPRSQRTRSVVSDVSEIGEEPPLEAYRDRNAVRIGRPCPLKKDLYTLSFLANVEHWYNIPINHSEADMDYVVNNILTLVAVHFLLISALLRNALHISEPEEI